MNKEEFDKANVFGKGNPNVNYAQYFMSTGTEINDIKKVL